MRTTTRRTGLEGAGLGTLAIGSAVGDIDVVITYEVPASMGATRSRGSTLDGEPAPGGALLTDAEYSSRYETELKVADLAPGDHIYTVAATTDGKVLSGSTIFTVPAA